MDTGPQRRPATPRRRLGRRTHPPRGPIELAGRDAPDRPRRRPHPGAQLRFTDVDGNRLTAFVTNTRRGQLADLELRQRRRARPPQAGGTPSEDRIKAAKDVGLQNLPLHDFDQNQIWTAIVMLAQDLIAWLQLLGLHAHEARRWEPKTLRYRLFAIAGKLGRTNRRPHLRLAAMPHTALTVTAAAILNALDPG